MIDKAFAYAFAGAMVGLMVLAVFGGIVALIEWIPAWLLAAAMGSGALIGVGTLWAETIQRRQLAEDNDDIRHLYPLDNVETGFVPEETGVGPWPTYDPFTKDGEASE
jgi:hypothetical protein